MLFANTLHSLFTFVKYFFKTLAIFIKIPYNNRVIVNYFMGDCYEAAYT